MMIAPSLARSLASPSSHLAVSLLPSTLHSLRDTHLREDLEELRLGDVALEVADVERRVGGGSSSRSCGGG